MGKLRKSPRKVHVRRGDEVVVISGEERGKRGRILAVYPERQRVLIEGVNLVKKAMRQTQNTAGGIVDREAPVHASNVMKASEYDARRSGKGQE
jgi:large subunit ribosomal protein L24